MVVSEFFKKAENESRHNSSKLRSLAVCFFYNNNNTASLEM